MEKLARGTEGVVIGGGDSLEYRPHIMGKRHRHLWAGLSITQEGQ